MGDFHTPLWSDAKAHAAGLGDLGVLTAERVAASRQRTRLYPQLGRAFLVWWNEKRRWINEPFHVVDRSIHARLPIASLEATIKIDNFLAVQFEDGSYRLVYPYFDEQLPLDTDAARLALWLISQALPEFPLQSFRILDVLRSRSFSSEDAPFKGNEEEMVLSGYTRLIEDWKKLRSEY